MLKEVILLMILIILLIFVYKLNTNYKLLEMIIIGNKPYKNIDISDILDKFECNMRFNFGLPGYNNGTKKHIQIVNIHVYNNLKKNNLDIPRYNHIDKNFKNKIKNELKPKNYPLGIKLMKHKRRKIYNVFLKKINCPHTFSSAPRMGIHGVMTSVIDNKRPFVTHFSLDKEANRLHIYNNIDNHSQCNKYHSGDDEFKILKWLHQNDKIDSTLCLLLDTKVPTLECSDITPKFESIMMLLEKFGICILNNCNISKVFIRNKLKKKCIIKRDNNKIIIKYKKNNKFLF